MPDEDHQRRPAADRLGVASVDRALTILNTFATSGASRSLAELSRATGLVKPTILRSLVSLERMGYVVRMSDGRYQLGARVMQLGAAYRNNFRLDDHVLPVLESLAIETGESAAFHIRERDMRLCLFRVESPQAVRDFAPVPTLTTLDETATGYVLRGADWEQELMKGPQAVFATSGVYDAQTASISTAVFGTTGILMGALTVSGPINRLGAERLPSLAESIARSANRLSTVLGSSHPVPLLPPRLIAPSGTGCSI